MTGRTPPGGGIGSKTLSHRTMSARWNRAFSVLLLLSLISALLSGAVIERVESTFASSTDELNRETTIYDRMVGGLYVENDAAHAVLDRGSLATADFIAGDSALGAAFTDAFNTYNSDDERDIVRDAVSQWVAAYAALRVLAADPTRADAFAVDAGPAGDAAHLRVGTRFLVINQTLHQLDLKSRSLLQTTLDRAHADKTRLLILLGAICVATLCATIMYARRMANRVVRPIRLLRESADRFGAGELDYRVELHLDDEIGELADRFNVMADTIASTHRHLTAQAHHDALTGLVNRAGFVGRLDAAMDPAGPIAGSVSLMFIDLDDFKHVNDDLGHAAGDELLRQVADRLRGAARSGDVVCRLGGDEFAVLVGSSTNAETTAREVAERILAVLEQPFSVHGSLIRVGASIGIASQTSGGDSGDDLLRSADVAMYSAKAQGKHRWQVFDPLVHGPVIADVSSILARLEAGDLDETPREYRTTQR
jgi:diguanylate cyclase (GGDEF)-like protein